MALVSAHRADAGAVHHDGDARAALVAAAASGAAYVEVDVQRTADGVFVVSHDEDVVIDGRSTPIASLTAADLQQLRGAGHLTLAQALDALAGRAAAHVDLKVASPPALRAALRSASGEEDLEGSWEVLAVRQVLDACGDDGALITSASTASVALLRRWARASGHPGLRVGLSLGRGVRGLNPWQAARSLCSELFPGPRLRRCDANLVVAQKELALLAVARWARRHGVPLLVWTVDTDRQLAHWLAPGRAWVVTTNRPDRALQIAASLPGRGRSVGRRSRRTRSVPRP